MNGQSAHGLVDQLRLENRFRGVVWLNALAIAFLLRSLGRFHSLQSLLWIVMVYFIPCGLSWLWVGRNKSGTTLIRYVLSVLDFSAITASVAMTGGPLSPFFYLYPIPFLVHAFQFDLQLILWDGTWSIALYGGTIWLLRQHLSAPGLYMGLGQIAFLGVVVATAVAAVRQFRLKDGSVERSLTGQRTMVKFLGVINALPPNIPEIDLRAELLAEIRKALEPFHVNVRLWLADAKWKTLAGFGEHPALKPGSTHHLPMSACPAFSLKKTFNYSQAAGEPCASEQFNYSKHLCLPIINEQTCFGVLFLGTYSAGDWDPEELHLFEMLAQSVALTLQRRSLVEKLEDKISELNFSFEVGAASLATFGGSTQSIEETTVRILDSVLAVLKVERASLMLWDPHAKQLTTQWVRGGDFKVQSPLTLKMGEGMAGWALQTGEPYWAEYAMGDPHYLESIQPIRSLLSVPVYGMDRRPVGVINAVTTKQARAFLPHEVNFLISFGRQAALAIENARLHQKSRENIDQLHEVNKLKSQFLSLVSHDLRGPLTGIRGFCEILKQESIAVLSPRQSEMIDQLERQVDLQERMVDDLLDLARMEKNKFSIHPSLTNLTALLKEEVEKSQLEARERRIALSLSISIPPSVSHVEIDGDRIRQVLWNLIHNALKFTSEDGSVVVRGIMQETSFVVEVEDTGVGLATDTQERVFEKFFQVSPGGSTSSQGLGLGLAICKEIVLAHRGTIQAHSPGLGKGTLISVNLPRSSALSQVNAKTLAA